MSMTLSDLMCGYDPWLKITAYCLKTKLSKPKLNLFSTLTLVISLTNSRVRITTELKEACNGKVNCFPSKGYMFKQ